MKALPLAAILLCFCAIAQAQPVPNEARASLTEVTRAFVLDRDIPLRMNVAAINKRNPVQLAWVRYFAENGKLHARVRVIETTVADAKWRLAIELIDAKGKQIGRSEGIFETRRLYRGVASVNECDYNLPSFENIDPKTVSSFRLEVSQAPFQSAVNLEASDPMRDLRLTGRHIPKDITPCVLRVNVKRQWLLFRPSHALITVWRAYDRTDPNLPRSAMWDSEQNYWPDEADPNVVWVRTHAKPELPGLWTGMFSSVKMFRLIPGDYRVSLVNMRQNDHSPLGMTGPVSLKKPADSATLKIAVQKGSQVTINIVDPADGKPVNKVPIYIRRADGFPLVITESHRPLPIRLQSLPAGRYDIAVGDTGWRSGYRDPDEVNLTRSSFTTDGRTPVELTLKHSVRKSSK